MAAHSRNKFKSNRIVCMPVMMLTSAGHLGDGARCRALGISAYLVKPIRQRELLDAICQVLGAGPQTPDIPLVTRHTLHEEKSSFRILLAEDNAVNQVLAVRLLEKRGYSVVVAANGRAAVEAFEKKIFIWCSLIFKCLGRTVSKQRTRSVKQKRSLASTYPSWP